VFQASSGDGEVRCEHGSRDFVTVSAIADKSVKWAWALSWPGLEGVLEQRSGINLKENEKGETKLRCETYECQLHGATKACRRCLIFFRTAVIGRASKGEVGRGLLWASRRRTYLATCF
jgi:hypothetical protein